MTADNEYPKASNATLIGASITYVAGLFLLLSFAGPYWIESYPETFSSFKRMGLWEYCFERFRFPSYQFDKLFNGCHYVFSQEFYVIREWLLPGWLMSVQAFVTLALILSLAAQILQACVIVRWPLRTVLRYEWIFVSSSFIMVALSSAFLLLASIIFGANAYRRDWLLYPSFNVLSWSYAFAVIACLLFAIASLLLYVESRKLYELRLEAKNLVAQMQHSQPEHALAQLRDQLQQQRQWN
ncbi:PMP-22/EMP/MP20/Claudin tight junction domain-containing protein [Phthorimaea operculella]|nr:PMP-22/EMP/MP20/Claudin tight junction domain-containing protein [Phthorimaea operculella]